ncbi:MAG: hypothetical protein V4754_18810 [Pseudomonadota bacterium]
MKKHRKRYKKGHKSAAHTNATKNSVVKVVVKADDSGKWVKPETLGRFYIDEEAIFPSIEFEIETQAPGPYNWSWNISWDAHVSGLREKTRGKKVASFQEQGQFISQEKIWNAQSIKKTIGGRLTVIVEVGAEKYRRTVIISAKQPKPDAIRKYLRERDGSALEKLVEQESRFKHLIDLDGEPVVAGDKGYGLTQLTHPTPTYSKIWSWKENVNAGLELIATKKNAAKAMLGKNGRTYTQDMLDLETISRWNGGSYHHWNAADHKWERNPNILCDSQTGNIGWDMENSKNTGHTEAELRKRDKEEYGKMKAGQNSEHPWTYTGVCYADHVVGN